MLSTSPQALAQGVGLLGPAWSSRFASLGMLSALGRCHSFDRQGDGYARADGAACFLLAESQPTCDSPEFSVTATAVQSDGPSASLSAPNGSAQRRLIMLVQPRQTFLTPTVPVECHGTGTLLGDPIEIGAVASALCSSSLVIQVCCSSFKSRMGHLEATASGGGLLCAFVSALESNNTPSNA